MDEMVAWLSRRWVIGAGFMAAAGLAALPIIATLVSLPVLLIFLCSPIYMVHQVEEHHHDRFRCFVNDTLFAGRCAMTRRDVLIVNVPVVWGLNLGAAYVAYFLTPAAGMVAGYAMLVNAVGHLIAAARLHGYNPGLLSAALLFVPLGTAVVVTAGPLQSTSVAWHIAAFGGALVVHIAIAASAFWRAEMSTGRMPG